MREIFFNSFKEKMMNGKVPSQFDVIGFPVNSSFMEAYDNDEIAITQYRNIEDFKTYSKNVENMPSFESTLFKFDSYDVEYSAYEPDDLSEKPIFVNSENSAAFFESYKNDIDMSDGPTRDRFMSYLTAENEDDLSELANVNSGFYYVTKKTHLNWIAKRCNDEYDFNNKIRIVLGDDIGNMNDRDDLESMICTTPERPFQGIFDLNGHKIINKRFICKNNSNGIIGYLGPKGIVRNGIIENFLFDCRKKISIEKIVSDCCDVFAAALVGTNYGTVENIVTSGYMCFDGFTPEVYLVSNKYEYTPGDSTSVSSAYNGFFPNKFCLNSIYNTIPYVGYFAEGADSYFNDIGRSKYRLADSGALDSDVLEHLTRDNAEGVLGYAEFNGHYSDYKNLDHYIEPKLSENDGYDQSNVKATELMPSSDKNAEIRNISFINDRLKENFADVAQVRKSGQDLAVISPLISTEYTQMHMDRVLCNTVNNLKSWKSFDEEDEYKIREVPVDSVNGMLKKDCDHASYIAQQIRDTVHLFTVLNGEKITAHQKLNPNAKIAFFCSPIVGNNFGTIRNIDCRHVIRESDDTFVGFIGNVCGKENCGDISRVNSILDIEKNENAENSQRIYTKNKRYAPEYGDQYGNLTQLFCYNYDYYQTPNGISDLTAEDGYSVHSADCMVSEKFYDFHDFICSGVRGECYDDYVFNKYENKTSGSLYSNCNFRVTEDQDVSEIGSSLPASIRDAKLSFGKIRNTAFPLFDFLIPNTFAISYELEDFPKDQEDPANVTHYPYQGEVKLFDNFDDSRKSNVSQSLIEVSDRAGLLSLLEEISFDVRRFDLNYLGDACKTLLPTDNIGGLDTDHENPDGAGGTEEVKLSLEDILIYSSAFHGECGYTKDGAVEFARNIMNSKIAVGCDMLANPYFSPTEQWNGWEDPFGGSEKCPFGTENKSSVYDSRYNDGKFKIEAGVGPNGSDQDWNIFSDPDDGPDMCWYCPPAESTYGTDGPKPTDTKMSLGSYTICESGYKPNQFCSVREDMHWDVYFRNQSDYGEYAEKIQDLGIQRSMITIEPIRTDALDDKCRQIFKKICEETNLLDKHMNRSITGSIDEQLSECFGDGWFVRLNKIKIPLANRTQNRSLKSYRFMNKEDLYGIYISETDSAPRSIVDYVDGRYETVEGNEWVNSDGHPRVGNLDDMFLDMSIVSYSENGNLEARPFILRLPIKKLFIPISAVEQVGEIEEIPVERYTTDFANWQNPVSGMTYKVRHVNYYPLIPAYDPEDTNGSTVSYKLESIYNIGGICGMINSSEKRIEYGNHLTDAGFGVNRATLGRIDEVAVMMTKRAADFIDGLCESMTDQNGEITDSNDRAIGIASKFALIAAVYEYHQNEMGTSPDPGLEREIHEGVSVIDPYARSLNIDTANTNGLTRIDSGAQKFYISRALLASDGTFRLSDVNNRIFTPMIEWTNVSNLLDYVNFFEKRFCNDADSESRYIAYQSSNYPEMINIMHNYCSLAADAWYDQKIRGNSYNWLSASGYPVFSLTEVSPFHTLDEARDGDTIPTTDLYIFGKKAGDDSIRNRMSKRYYFLPHYLIGLLDVIVYDNGNDPILTTQYTHMSPSCLFPNSDYHDIYQQMFSGSPNFVFSKLSKPTQRATLIQSFTGVVPEFSIKVLNQNILDEYARRTVSGIRDRYFTWDYDMYLRDENPDLNFTIRYAKVNGKRALWIHQNDETIDNSPWLQYWMRGDSECKNDGGNIHLGYMPSESSLIEIMNRVDPNDTVRSLGDEGIAIDGEDFRGIVLAEENGDLVAVIDAEYGRDISSGCYIAELSERTDLDGRAYGLLAEIEREE